MLEWAGDVGGLFDGLVLIAGIFISPIANYSLASRFASQLQRFAQSDSKKQEESLLVYAKTANAPQSSSKCQRALQCFIKRRNHMKKLISLRETAIESLDLIKIMKQRMT